MGQSTLVAGFVGFLFISYLIQRLVSSSKNRGHPLPPGPKGLPIVGNINDLPKPGALEAHHWLKHKDLYGPLSSVTVMGQTIIIINDPDMAIELLEKRSAKHSSRPGMVFIGEMVGWEHGTGGAPYNERFRVHRKHISRIIGSKTTAAQYNKMQEAEAGHFLLHLLEKPDDFVDHIKREAGSLILKIVYGYTAEPFERDPFVDMVGEAMDNFSEGAIPGAFHVYSVRLRRVPPSSLFADTSKVRYVPSWFPGTGWQQTAKQWRDQLVETREKPYAFVEQQVAQGKDSTSFLARLIGLGDSTPAERFEWKWAAVSLYGGGADTTVSSIACFFLAMTLFPEVQRKAQEEIDRVVGSDRLPTVNDRENLPYIEAVVKEVMRWHPVGPMGLPHSSTEDDVYEGYFIPKDAMLFPNIWFVFGFGRRICPGRILAESSLYINIAQALSVYSITKPVFDGKLVEPAVKFTSGVVSHPEPFKTSIKPRSAHHEQLIRSIVETYPWEPSDAKTLESLKF
ncbi:O-methylsterigmatocystin oxidoreductase 2 [Colletotrichum chlorophyti]|uniref:O-methylsterigmatocystin oxidoreductase 2 n=1 Tax=Colletotrichum chlorophyti TaxID=708187 RepID=A0A1Q8RCN6_9PEZI|nr:O-methylsterigmatocystin oxidoreductase 2 [Colletotrichum chlorophyti]